MSFLLVGLLLCCLFLQQCSYNSDVEMGIPQEELNAKDKANYEASLRKDVADLMSKPKRLRKSFCRYRVYLFGKRLSG